MSEQAYRFALSALDKSRFGVTTARVEGLTAQHVPELLDHGRAEGVVFIIVRCAATDFETVHALERSGFRLMDTLVYWARDLCKTPLPLAGGEATIRLARPDEAEQVAALARDAFRGYFGHYHADNRLDRAAADETYASWAERSVRGEAADAVLVAELGNMLAGFATLRLNSEDEGEGVLFGVSPQAQRRGIYQAFIGSGLEWCAEQGASRMVLSTQLVNVAVQKVWARAGFELSHAYYTFHGWLDET